jgi:hypothetical protein
LYLLHRAGPLVPPKVRAFVDFVKKGLVLVPAKTARSPMPRR